jgi:hypothetical protein
VVCELELFVDLEPLVKKGRCLGNFCENSPEVSNKENGTLEHVPTRAVWCGLRAIDITYRQYLIGSGWT